MAGGPVVDDDDDKKDEPIRALDIARPTPSVLIFAPPEPSSPVLG